MKISRRQYARFTSSFKQFDEDKSIDYFKRNFKHLVKNYLRFFRRRRHIIVGHVLKFCGHRAVIAHNLLRIRGGLTQKRRRAHSIELYGFPIATQKRKSKCVKKKKLPIQLQNVSSTTRPLISEKNQATEEINVRQNVDAVATETATSLVITNSHAENGTNISKTAAEQNTMRPLNDDFNESDTNNIWKMDLATVALEMTDENLKSADDDELNTNTNENSVNNISMHVPVMTSTPILARPNERQASPVEDINDKLRQQLKLLKMGKPEKSLLSAPGAPIITRISLRRNTIATTPLKPLLGNDKVKTNDNNAAAISQNTSPSDVIATNGNRNSLNASVEKDPANKSKIIGGVIDSLFNRLKSFGGRTTPPASADASAAVQNIRTTTNIRRPNTPLSDAQTKPKKSRMNRTTDDRPYKPTTTINSVSTVRELLNIKRMRTQEQEDDDNVSTCSSSNADFLGFDVTNKNIDVSALLPTPRVPKSSKESVFVSDDLDAFMKENSLENVANVEFVVAAKMGDVDEGLITEDAQPPNLTIPERPVDMQRPRTLAEKRLILQRQQDVHYQMIEHESTVYHELKKRVRLGSAYNNQLLRSIQDAEIPFTRDCWRATCWINTDNNYFFYRTIACGDNELKLAGGRGNNKSKLYCKLTDEIDNVKMDIKGTGCMCPAIGKIKINNYDAHHEAIESLTHKDADAFAMVKKLNHLKREYIRPCPLSKKPKVAKRTSLDIEYGQLEILTMPTVQLEVWPEIGRSLPDELKPLLKTIVSKGNVITTEWAQFAVSVVVQSKPSSSQRPQKQQRKYKRPEPEERKSFVFDIPYVNNQTRIIVRRRRHPLMQFAANGRPIREPIEAFYELDSDELAFAKNVNRNDAMASACADALAAMIESVAVTLNENNFIRNDPDLDYVGKIVEIQCAADAAKMNEPAPIDAVAKDKPISTTKMDKGTSKMKVMKELKRLNVTIINAVPDENRKIERKRENCKSTFCRLGCVCDSISMGTIIPNRCSNTKCMFVCKCSSSINQPHFNVPADLINKDLGKLHARATARLAKEEKDFTSTIVVSDHDMFVLPNSGRSTKRNTKKPKRYNECMDSYDSAEDADSSLHQQPSPKRPRQEQPNPYKYDQNLIDALRHVLVRVKKLPELDVEAWCMVHCLYKCYCNGTAVAGKPFSFADASANGAEKPVDESSNNVVEGTTMNASSHWESIPPRRRQYSFDRGATSKRTMQAPREKVMSPTNSTTTSAAIADLDIAEQRTMRAARTRMFRWTNDTRSTVHEVRELRRQCEEMEGVYRNYLSRRVELCKQYFLRECWKTRETRDQKQPVKPDADASDDIQFVAEMRLPEPVSRPSVTTHETSVTQLNRIITHTMRTVCATQRRSLLKLNTEKCKMSIVRWDRMLAAFRQKEVLIWHTELNDDSSVLLLTNDANNAIPTSMHIRNVTNISNVNNNQLPLVAKLLKMATKNDETDQLAVLLFRLSTFWRIVGVMHSDKRYIREGLHASPSAGENPELTQKIDQLHKLLIQKESQRTTHVAAPTTAVPAAQPAAAPAMGPSTQMVTARSNLPTLRNLHNMNETQLQLLLPIPLSQDQRWLMMTLGNDFTHIWLPQWRKFLSYKRIRSALTYASQTRKTIELSPPECHPSVFATCVRSNQIFVGPYHMNEPQKLALFHRHADGRMLLSENYAKLPNVEPFERRSIGSWIYTSKKNGDDAQGNTTTSATNQSTEKSNPVRLPTTPIIVVNNNINNNQQTMSQLKIQSVYSFGGELAGQSAMKESIKPILVPISMPQNTSDTNNRSTNSIVRILNPPNAKGMKTISATVTHSTAVTAAKMSASIASATTSSSTSKPIIITKVSQHNHKMPIIASIRSYGDTKIGKLPIISSIRCGEEVQQSLNDNNKTSASSSPQSSLSSTLVELIPVNDAITTNASKNTFQSEGPIETIDLSDDDDDDNDDNDDANIDCTQVVEKDPLAVGKVIGYIICPTNKDLGKIPAEIVGNLITLKIPSCDKEAELPLDVDGAESYERLTTVDKYMSQLITNIAYNVHPKNLLLKWIFCPETSDDHKPLPIHSTKALNSYSVIFKDNSLSIQGNYATRIDLSDERKYILDVEKLASKILPRNVARECQLKDIIYKAQKIETKLESERVQLAAMKDRYHRLIAEKLHLLRSMKEQRKTVARTHGPE